MDYSYDDDGVLQTSITLLWDGATNAFVKSTKMVYQYDDQGEQIGYSSYTWNKSTSKWDLIQPVDPETALTKSEEILDEGVVIGYISYYRPDASSEWTLSSKVEYVFDSESGEQIGYDMYSWNGSDWTPLMSIETIYEDDDIITSSYQWDGVNIDRILVSQSKSAQEFDGNGNLSIVKLYSRTSVEAAWTYTGKSMYYYHELSGTEGIHNISSINTGTLKLFLNGQLYILRDGKTYNIMGAEVE